MADILHSTLRRAFGTASPLGPKLRRASPTAYVSASTPPFLIIQAVDDDVVPLSQSRLLYAALSAQGAPASLVLVRNADHNYCPLGGEMSPTAEELVALVADFFDAALGRGGGLALDSAR